MSALARRLILRLRLESRFLRERARTLAGPVSRIVVPEIHVFVLWANALPAAPRILDDIGRHFVIRDVVRVTWPRSEFSWNLTRFYGGRLPAGSEKERHCGTGPFLVVVVEDPQPVYAPRRSSTGTANARVFDAKQRYRAWTGGGHRVHASDDRAEAEHDLFLLLGRTGASYSATPEWNGDIADRRGEVTGAEGWRDVDELAYAVSTATETVRVDLGDGGLTLVAREPVRAALTANVRPGAFRGVGRHEVLVSGVQAKLEVRRAPHRQDVRMWSALTLRGRTLLDRAHAPVAAILVYHRIADPVGDPFRICVSAPTFAGHLEALRSRYEVVALEQLVDAHGRAASTRPVVVVTFDDGYADTLEAAYPVAAAADVPVTAFVTVEPVVAGEPFWWDELSTVVLAARNRPLALDLDGTTRQWAVSTEEQRLHACREVHRLLRGRAAAERRRALDRLASQVDADARAPQARPLREAELRKLDALPGVLVGAHTLSHPSLASLPEAQQIAEVEGSKRRLGEMLGRDVDLFAYPYGRGDDLSLSTIRVVADAGFRAACTTVQAGVTRRTPPHALPRLTVYESSPEQLVTRVRRVLRDR